MVTQTPDYLIPNTAIILQDRLGLSKNTACFDIPLGCSGFVYGASVISSMLTSQGFKKGLLLLVLLSFSGLSAQEIKSLYQTKKVAVSNDTIAIEKVSISPSFFKLLTREGKEIDTTFYKVDFKTGKLFFKNG